MFLGKGASKRALWQVLLVRDFLRGLYLSRSRAGDGQNKIVDLCACACVSCDWPQMVENLYFP